MSIFPFIQTLNTALVDQYGFDSVTAGTLYSVPYFMSAALSPILGFLIDKIGKRALMITISSVLVAFSCFFSACLPNYTEPNFICLVPLILVGFGYSIYASALWSSIPYLVIPRTIGSAFGLVTSLQACGLVFAPYVVGRL
jgi:MFS family permease